MRIAVGQLWQRREEYLTELLSPEEAVRRARKVEDGSVVLRHDHVRIVVTSRSGPHFAPELFQAAGLDPFGAAVLVAKSPAGFRAAYASRALAIYSVQAPGCAPADFWNYPFANIPHPLWPWDELHHWRAQPVLVYHGEAR